MKKKVLVSKCLLGQRVRWNGGQKLDGNLSDWARENNIELIPVCPEDDLFGTPRPPIRLIQVEGKIQAEKSGQDISDLLRQRCEEIVNTNPDVIGFIGISKSPTCGISVGVKNLGRVVKGYLHEAASFPTTESNQLRRDSSREIFLSRIKKYSGHK